MSDDFDPRLLDLLYGELTPDEAHAVEAELAQDADARQTMQGWRRVRAAVEDLPVPEPDPQVHYSILRAAREAVEPAKPKGIWAWLAGVALNPALAGVAVMALAVGSVVFLQLRDDAPDSALDEAARAPADTQAQPQEAAVATNGRATREAEAADPKARGAAERDEVRGPTGEPANARNEAEKADAIDAEDAIADLDGKTLDGVEPGEGADGFGRAGGGGRVADKAPALRDAMAKTDGDDDSDDRAAAKIAPAKKSRARRVARERAKAKAAARPQITGKGASTGSSAGNADVSVKKTSTAKPRRSRAKAAPKPRPVAKAPEGAAREASRRFAPPPPAPARRGAKLRLQANGDAEADKAKIEPARNAPPPEEKTAETRVAPAARDAKAEVVEGGRAERLAEAEDGVVAPGAAAGKDLLEEQLDDDAEARVEGVKRPAKATVAPKIVLPAPRGGMAFDSGGGSGRRASAGAVMGDSLTGGGDAPSAAPMPTTLTPRADEAEISSTISQDVDSVARRPAQPLAEPAPAVPPALTQARAARARGDHRAAVGAYARYFQRNPRDGQFSRGLFEAAASHEALGQFDQAIRLYGLVPSNAGALYTQAQARIDALEARAARARSDAAGETPADAEDGPGSERVEPRPQPPGVEPPR